MNRCSGGTEANLIIQFSPRPKPGGAINMARLNRCGACIIAPKLPSAPIEWAAMSCCIHAQSVHHTQISRPRSDERGANTREGTSDRPNIGMSGTITRRVSEASAAICRCHPAPPGYQHRVPIQLADHSRTPSHAPAHIAQPTRTFLGNVDPRGTSIGRRLAECANYACADGACARGLASGSICLGCDPDLNLSLVLTEEASRQDAVLTEEASQDGPC